MRKYLPYAPAGSPGVWRGVSNMLPMRSGAYYPGNFSSQKVGAGPAAPGTVLRAWCALLPADTAVGYIGTTTKLWQYDGVTTFTDRSKGGGYTNTATDWSFAQFGNVTIATNRIDAPQSRDASGVAAFADLAGTPPKAKIVVTQQSQVLLFDLNDGAEKPDYFASCAPLNQIDWSSASATVATPIWHRPGRITAAVAFKDYVLAFKRSSVYRLTYTGATYKWKVELIAIGRGAWGKHDVVNCGDVVIFSGPGGVWSFDGASFRSVSDYFGEVNHGGSTANTSQASFFAPLSGNVFLWGEGYSAWVYNLVSERWGRASVFSSTVNPLTTDYRVFTGEPAALRTFVGPTAALPDLAWLLELNAPVFNAVVASDTLWGNGSSAKIASLGGGIEGIGSRTITNFGGLELDTTISGLGRSSDVTPGATELKLDIYIGSARETFNLDPNNTGATAAQSNILSSTAQRRFDFQQSAVYACFVVKLPGDSGYIEINDYRAPMQPDGEL